MLGIDPEMLLLGFGIFLRAGALFYLLPFMNRPVPVTVRAALALLVAVLLAPLVEAGAGLHGQLGLWPMVILGIREIFIGFLMGYAVQVIFYVCQVAGRLLSMEIGLMQSNLFNPLMGQQETVLGTGMTMMSIVLIFTLDIHHQILFAFARSLELMPVGFGSLSAGSGELVVRSVGNIFLLAVQMSAPLIAVNYIVTLGFAILGRAVPTVNVLILSFGVRIGVGFAVLILVFVVVAQFLLGLIQGTPERMLQFLPFR